ncbi:MAG: ComEC/Rec2 family competence protein [Candidatus Falkowbacteria bacterium]
MFKLRRKEIIFWLGLIILLALRFYFIYLHSAEKVFSDLNNKKINLRSVVLYEPDVRDSYQKIIVGKNNFKILLTVDKYPEYLPGDIVAVSGKLQRPDKIENFDYPAYLAKEQIYFLAYYPKIAKIGQEKSIIWLFKRNLIAFKKRALDIINLALSEPESGLANALVLGYKYTVSKDDLDKFSLIGISHIIAISGSHITLLAAIIDSIFLFFAFSRRQSFWGSLVLLFLYVVMTGCQAPAVRALVMGGLLLYGKYIGRLARITRILFFALAMMLLYNPRYLISDVGFQLSFLAIIALIYVYPVLKKRSDKLIAKIKSKFWQKKVGEVMDIFVMTIACELLSWPILVFNFGRLSLIAPVANALIIWVFAVLIILALVALSLSFIYTPLAPLWFLPSYFLLKYIFIMTNFFANLPFAALKF